MHKHRYALVNLNRLVRASDDIDSEAF